MMQDLHADRHHPRFQTPPADWSRQARMAEAERFLTLLDEAAESFCFQTFDDRGQRPALAKTLHGTLPDLFDTLDQFNRSGSGVFLAVNEVAPGSARTTEHVLRVRAVFADFDPPKTQGPPEVYPIAPVIEVESSPGKRHVYWTIDDLPLEDFRPLQRAIVAALGSDPALVDLPRVMRLPGFRHMKDPARPHWVRLIATDERLPYRPEDLKRAFPPVQGQASTARVDSGATAESATAEQIAELRSALLAMRSDDRELWVRMGHALAGLGDIGRGLWLDWSATSEKFDAKDAARVWGSLHPDRTGYAAVFAEAQRRGWLNPKKKAMPASDDRAEDAAALTAPEVERLLAWSWRTGTALPDARTAGVFAAPAKPGAKPGERLRVPLASYPSHSAPWLKLAWDAGSSGFLKAAEDYCTKRADMVEREAERTGKPPEDIPTDVLMADARAWLARVQAIEVEDADGRALLRRVTPPVPEPITEATRATLLARAHDRLALDHRVEHEYPLDALGGTLGPAARAISERGQVDPAMAGQSVLAVAALLVQHTANVRTIESIKPLSLYLLTIGESGDGKSTADAIAQRAVQERQRRETKAYMAALDDTARAPKGETVDAPPEPYRIARDGTVEGIRRSFAHGVASQAVFSSEAAAMLAGYGMNADNRAKTAATFNGLWDDGEVSVSRGVAGRIQLYDRRLSIHWLIQPEAAQETMGDPLLSGIGFWPRFLLAWPNPSPPRKARPWIPEHDGRIADYYRACNRLLDIHLRPDCADILTIEPSEEAMSLACAFFERMEKEAKGRDGLLRDVRPYAVRATEQAFRIAGVLSAFEGRHIICADTMRNAQRLALYSIESWRGVFGDRDESQSRAWALRLLAWLIDQPEARATSTAMLKIGPKALRSRSRRDTATSILEQLGLIRLEGQHWYVNGTGSEA